MQRFHDARDWFLDARFGLFIHWGPYAVPGWHEQHIFRRKLSRKAYIGIMRRFNPVGFNPDSWLDQAEATGMRYLCFTTKHIDGFCMWDTETTHHKITQNEGGIDVLKRLADACHRRNFPLCLYYSIADHVQPSYPHAGRAYEFVAPPPGDQPDLQVYADVMRKQIHEICSRYGKIHGFWWDANIIPGFEAPGINTMIRDLQPGIVINNRGPEPGDFKTPERDWDQSVHVCSHFESPVEACQSIGLQSWGYRRNEDYYTDAHLIGSIHAVLAKGGNYLLNVGPKPDGSFPAPACRILDRIGRWFTTIRESVLEVEPVTHLFTRPSVLLTRRATTLYAHVVRELCTDAVYLHPLAQRPRRAILLNTGRALSSQVVELPTMHSATPNHCLCFRNLPAGRGSRVGWVIRMDFDRWPDGLGADGVGDTDRSIAGAIPTIPDA